MLEANGIVRGVYFSLGTTPIQDPKFDCANAVINLFNQAKDNVHVAIFALTEPDIVNAMIAAYNRGIKIEVITDATQSKSTLQASMIKKLTVAGIKVWLTIRQNALMHNKVGIFDGQTICTGSFNWTINAEKRNDENLLVVDGKDLANDYEEYVFQRILKNETLIKTENIKTENIKTENIKT